MPSETSSFMRREISKEDAIKQFFRPMLANRSTQAFDVFDRFVSYCEEITTLGTTFQAGKEKLLITPAEVEASMDEFAELKAIATKGRALLKELGYVSPRTTVPMAGAAPVGKNVDVVPIEISTPGQEPLQATLVQPKQA